MKPFGLTLLGLLLLLPFYAAEAQGIDIDTFRDEVYRPDNLPSAPTTRSTAETRINEILQFAIDLVLYASGSVAVLFLVIGGVRYITSFGNQERMDAAKKTVLYAVIGLAAVILAFALVTNVIEVIFRATT